MTREEAHQLVDEIFNGRDAQIAFTPPVETATVVPDRVLPEGKRVVRTTTSGDRVYFLDEVKKTRQWVTNPDVLDSLGFTLNDVTEIGEEEMLKYQMGSALYKRVDG